LTLSESATQEREISLKPHKKDENLPKEEKKEKKDPGCRKKKKPVVANGGAALGPVMNRGYEECRGRR
jgi:hypothetical protein